MLFIYLFTSLSYIYSSVYRRNIKRNFNINNYVQDHHIIPREFRSIVNYTNKTYCIDCSNNIMMLPNNYGKLFLNTKRSIHENGHIHYNRYVYDLIINSNNTIMKMDIFTIIDTFMI